MPLSRSDQARLNGAKSRGPKTSQGKARSALNALKHGRYAINAIVLSNEDSEAFEELVANYVRRIQPADTVEYHLTRELASIDWRLTRIFALDTRMLDHEMDVQAPALDSAGLAVPELTRLLAAGRSIVDRSQYPNYLARRETQLIRARQSVYGVLRNLRKNFPLAESASEVIPPEPLNPESPAPDEPGTNPTESGADPLVRAEPTGSAPENSTSGSASGKGTPTFTSGEAKSGAVSEEATLDRLEEPTGSAPENSTSFSASGKGAPSFTSGKAKSGAVSEKAPRLRFRKAHSRLGC